MDDLLTRMVEQIVGRVHGPMQFRMLLQPVVAILLAVRDGRRDAREGRPAFGYALFTDAEHRRELLRDGWKSVGRIFIFALLLDAVYQYVALRWFYPGEAIVVSAMLALLPYLLFRGLVNRLLSLRRSGAA